MRSVWLGQIDYPDALARQLQCVEWRAEGVLPDTLLLMVHPHVYTIGRGGDESNLLVSRDVLASENIAVERVGRGGDITYHGPGQLVGYPIVCLTRPDVHRFVRALETAIIDAVRPFGIECEALPGYPGVWAKGKKLASVGIGVRRWVTYHGFALNVNTDLSYFRRIHLCGLKGREATSMAEISGREMPMDPVRASVAAACGRRLRRLP